MKRKLITKSVNKTDGPKQRGKKQLRKARRIENNSNDETYFDFQEDMWSKKL